MKEKWKYIVLAVFATFIIYNCIWYFGIYKIYAEYEKDFPMIGDSGIKVYVDDEEYQYSVNKPTYLLWDGNLAISEKNTEHALIVWLGLGGKRDLEGVILENSSGAQEQIELINRDKAKDKLNQAIVDENKDIIDLLYCKAEEKWDLELK